MATLAGDFVGVVVGLGTGFMGCTAVTGFTGDLGCQVVLDQAFTVFIRRCGVHSA